VKKIYEYKGKLNDHLQKEEYGKLPSPELLTKRETRSGSTDEEMETPE
jgi:hypothetical protein